MVRSASVLDNRIEELNLKLVDHFTGSRLTNSWDSERGALPWT